MRIAYLAVVLSCACNYRVYSPPGRALPLESSATLARGRTSIGGELSVHGGAGLDGVVSGTVRIAHGVTPALEVQGEASYTNLHGEADSAAGTDPNLFQAYAGVKINPGTKYLALVAGLAGGTSAGGTFSSLSAGAILAYENCHFVPFAGVHGIISVPLDAQDVDITKTGDMTQHIDRPSNTRIVAVRAGVKIPLGRDDCAQPERVDLYAGAQILGLDKDTGHDGFLGFGLGAAWQF